MHNIFATDDAQKMLVSKEALLASGVYTRNGYKNQKSRGRFQETIFDQSKYVLLDSLPSLTLKQVIAKLGQSCRSYTQQLLSLDALGYDPTPAAIEFTADTLQINESFIRRGIENHLKTHYTSYTAAYLDAGLHSHSVKGYAKLCALVQWIYDFRQKITTGEASKKRSKILMRSFRANLLTALSEVALEIKIPLSEAKFNKWLDEIFTKMDKGILPVEIVQIKRLGNANNSKISEEQFKVAYFFYINGTNMSVETVYKKWIAFAKKSAWWTSAEGKFSPPTAGRLYQLLAPYKNAAFLEKTDGVKHNLLKVPSVMRDAITKKNHVWVIDGTAHNENVDNKGKVRQHVYVIKVIDGATYRLLGVSPLIGSGEPFSAVKEAILMGIRTTGYKPAMIHCDHGPAGKELEAWCEANDIRIYMSNIGNARAKIIESFFNMFDNDITRFMSGYNGGNLTSRGLNSHPSEKKESKGKRNARSASIAMEWAKGEGVKLWNERIIETLERKACNKTPYELWDEKESHTPKLDFVTLAQVCGTLHVKKLTISGLEIAHNTQAYTYFPKIETSEQRAKAAEIFTYVPLDAQTSNRLSVFVLEAGEPAPVFWGKKYLGLWTQKPSVGFTAGIDGTKEEKEVFGWYMALQHRVRDKAKTINKDIQQYISMHPDFENIEKLGKEALTGKHRAYTGRYDKSALLEQEADFKAGEHDGFELLEATPEIVQLVDPDTGEILTIDKNKVYEKD